MIPNLFEIFKIIMLSRALFVAANLEIADHLAYKSYTNHELAQITHADPDCLQRMMRFLITSGFFIQDDSLYYQHSESSWYLCKDHPQTVRPFVLQDDPTRFNSIGNLESSVMTGVPSFEMIYGCSYFEYIGNNQTLNDRFNESMVIVSQSEDALIANQIPFMGSIADIGGGTGNLAHEIVRQNHEVTHCFVVDICNQKEFSFETDALEYVYGSFFEPITVQADTFILKRILHDWNDAKALEIVRNVSGAMRQGTRLFIIDAIADQSDDPQLIAAEDLLMMTIFGGKERTLAEWEALCASANLKIVSTKSLTSFMHIIECELI